MQKNIKLVIVLLIITSSFSFSGSFYYVYANKIRLKDMLNDLSYLSGKKIILENTKNSKNSNEIYIPISEKSEISFRASGSFNDIISKIKKETGLSLKLKKGSLAPFDPKFLASVEKLNDIAKSLPPNSKLLAGNKDKPSKNDPPKKASYIPLNELRSLNTKENSIENRNVLQRNALKNAKVENVKPFVLDQRFTVNVSNMSLANYLSYLSGIANIPIELKDNVKENITFYQTGTLKDILNSSLLTHDLTWQYKKGKIIVRRYITDVMQLNMPMSTMKNVLFGMSFGQGVAGTTGYGMNNIGTIGTQGSTGVPGYQATGTANSIVSAQFNQKMQNIVNSIIKPLLTDPKSRVSYNPDTGILTFYGSVNDDKVVRSVVKKINKEISKPIVLKLTILALNLSREFQTGINLSSALSGGKFKISLIGNNLASSSSNGILSASYTTLNLSSLISVLENYGKLRTVDSEVYTVVPNEPIVYSPTQNEAYISNYTAQTLVTTTAPASSYVSPIISYVNQGTSIILLPRLTDEDNLLLEVYLTQNNIKSFQTQNITIVPGAPPNQIQLPNVDSKSVIMSSKLKPKQTLILLSAVEDVKQTQNSGVPFLVDFPIIGSLFGSKDLLSNKVQFIITVTYEGIKSD